MSTADLSQMTAEGVRQAIAAGADINELDGGDTPLTRAILLGKLDVAAVLLDAGADTSRGRLSPLGAAYKRGNRAAIDLLLVRGADLRHPQTLNAALRGGAELALHFLDHGGAFGEVEPDLIATAQGSPEAQAGLWERAVNAGVDPQGLLSTLVRKRSERIDAESVEVLLARGASLSPAARASPLHEAVSHFRLESARVLLACGASLDTPLAVEWVDEFNSKTWRAGLTVRELVAAVVRANVSSGDQSKWQRLRRVQCKDMAKLLGVEVGGKTGALIETATKRNPRSAVVPLDPASVKLPKGVRRFHHPSGKFWEVRQHSRELTTVWGRIGDTAQSASRPYGTTQELRLAIEKACAAKLKAGYVEVGIAPGPRQPGRAPDRRGRSSRTPRPPRRAKSGG